MTESRPPGLDHFSEADARRILKRASELEKQGVVTATDLREIAAGASISQAALDKAMAEMAQEKRLAEMTPRDPALDLPFYRQPINVKLLAWGVLAAWLVAGILSAVFGPG